MQRALCQLLLFACLLLTGCAGDTYAPVTERTSGGGSRGGAYEVSRGDTLYSIAWRHGVDHRDLASWNGIGAPYTIYPGQTLRLTAPAGGSGQRPPRQVASHPSTSTVGSASPSRTSPPAQPRSRADRPSTDIDWQWPVQGDVLKGFSPEVDGKQGINIGGDEGQDVRAAAPGRVVYSGNGLVGYGNLIILKHEDDYLTAYGYNRELLVAEGVDVRRGQIIARMGRSGNRPMLHFELRRDGRPVDPLGYLPQQR